PSTTAAGSFLTARGRTRNFSQLHLKEDPRTVRIPLARHLPSDNPAGSQTDRKTRGKAPRRANVMPDREQIQDCITVEPEPLPDYHYRRYQTPTANPAYQPASVVSKP